MRKAQLRPTAENTYKVAYGTKGITCDFGRALDKSRRQEADGDIVGACNTRFEAVQQFMELLPDSETVELDTADADTRDAMTLLHDSAIDHFLAGDFEMCAAMLETLLELDPEDRFEATRRLAYAYIALEEWELFDEAMHDIDERSIDKPLLVAWSTFRRTGELPKDGLPAVYMREFTAEEHPADEAYLRDVDSGRPSRETLVRQLWLQTEHLWAQFPGFIEALKNI
ncbi:MAG: tetratricopeptide repeat protein [Rikenellaceae bacterium]|nr:tetratricopeptide repeat protein [Rikenellaceae bacterium]MCL2692226.1 tetratricopeptide repeat protein [Rikenellaceae bacterium]